MIKLLTSLSGEGFSHQFGETVSLEKEFEARLIKSGQAEPVKAKKAAKNEAKSNHSSK